MTGRKYPKIAFWASLINIIQRFDTDVGSSLKKVSADYNPGDDYKIDLTLV